MRSAQVYVVNANHQVLGTYPVDEFGKVFIDDRDVLAAMAAESTTLVAAAGGYAPGYVEVDAGLRTDGYAIAVSPLVSPFALEGMPDDDAEVTLAGKGLDPFNRTMLAFRGELDHPSAVQERGGETVIDATFVQTPVVPTGNGSLGIIPALAARSRSARLFVVDAITLGVIGERAVALSDDGLLRVDTANMRDRLASGVWLVTAAEVEPLGFTDKNHGTTGADCHTGPWRSCQQKYVHLHGHNACNGGGPLTYTASGSVSFGISYKGASITISASETITYTFPGDRWTDLFLVVRGCNYRTCGGIWDLCTQDSTFSSCGDGGWYVCGLYPGNWYNVSYPKSCSNKWTATHNNSCSSGGGGGGGPNPI